MVKKPHSSEAIASVRHRGTSETRFRDTLPDKTHVGSQSNMIQLQLFQGVDMSGLEPLLSACDVRRCQAGEIVLSPQRENHEMMVILSGRMAVQLDPQDKDPLVVLSSGDSVGEMSVFDGKNPSAFVKALEPSELLVISRDLLWQMINASHAVARNLLYLLSCRVRTGNAAVTDSRQMQKEYERYAYVDPLTGLHNRRWLEELFKRLSYAVERELPSIIMIDVDHFKRINDEYGHVAGDHVLKTVVETISRVIRPMDMLARFGGEEFVAVLPRTRAKQALRVAERVRMAVSGLEVDVPTIACISGVTISSGVAQMVVGEALDDLIIRADEALYRAKDGGRNRSCEAAFKQV